MASQQAHQLLSQTLLQCIDSTLQTASESAMTRCAVAVSAPALQAAAHSSHAARWLAAWVAPSTVPPQPLSVSGISTSPDVSDMAQLAADAVASQAARSRVELYLGSAVGAVGGGPGANARSFKYEGGVQPSDEWLPSATYAVAVHVMLVHVFSRLVHAAAQDSTVLLLPGDARLEALFDAAAAPDEGTWPTWLGPAADLQGVLDEFGISIALRPLDPTQARVIPAGGQHFARAQNACCLSLEFGRPRSVDLLSGVPLGKQHLPDSPFASLPLALFQRSLRGRRVRVVPSGAPADPLADHVRASLRAWGCEEPAEPAAPADFVVVHENIDALRDELGSPARSPPSAVLFFARMPTLETAVAAVSGSPRASDAAFVPTPVSALRLLWALFLTTVPGTGRVFVNDHRLRIACETTSRSVQERDASMQPEEPEPAQLTSAIVQQGAALDESPAAAPAVSTPASVPALTQEAVDYFSVAVSQLAEQPHASSGLVIRNEDGRPAGIYFQPRAKDETPGPSEPRTPGTEAPDARPAEPEAPAPSSAPSPHVAADANEAQPTALNLSNARLSAEPAERVLARKDPVHGEKLYPSGHVIQPVGFETIPGRLESETPAEEVRPEKGSAEPAPGPRNEAPADTEKPLPTPPQRAPPASTPPAPPTTSWWRTAALGHAAQPSPYGQLPRRASRTSAQPQSGLLIGKRGSHTPNTDKAIPALPADARRNAPSSPPPPPPPPPALLSPSSLNRLQRKRNALREMGLPPINVLIVEDNVINQRILSTFLRRKKIQYQIAKDGREAVDKWRTGNFHLILMDIQLPVLSGIEATKEIRRLEQQANVGARAGSLPETPARREELTRTAGEPPSPVSPVSPARLSVIIVALTASVLTSDRVEALAAGCNDFLNKPVDLPWLQRKILEWGSMQYLLHAGHAPRIAGTPDSAGPRGPASAALPARTPPAPKETPSVPASRYKEMFDANARHVASNLRIDIPPGSAGSTNDTAQRQQRDA